MADDNGAYLPTREQIAAACERINRQWSDEERYQRRFGMMPGKRGAKSGGEMPAGWIVPSIAVSPEVAAALECA